jgi:hypothetical protein
VRVLVLLLVLLVSGAHFEAHAVPVAALAGESGGVAVESDLLDSAPRSPAGGDRRPVPPLRTAPVPDEEQPDAEGCRVSVSPSASYGLRTLRSVVLRC